jgi:hypothetical protein
MLSAAGRERGFEGGGAGSGRAHDVDSCRHHFILSGP